MRTHEWIDQRSRALDLAIADRIERQPHLIERARSVLRRWMDARPPPIEPALLEWDDILSGTPPDEIVRLLRRDDERIRRLRQSSPFCGILDPQERLAILKQYEAARA